MVLQAIETRYKGYRFRSRLEARWAVFFDALGVQWQYEPEGFDLDGVLYLPDFYLPQFDRWIEVKGHELEKGEKDWEKVARLATATGNPVYVTVGEVWMPYNGDGSGELANYWRPIHPGGNWASHSWFVECAHCRKLSIVVYGHVAQGECGCFKDYTRRIGTLEYQSPECCDDQDCPNALIQWSNSPRLRAAYKAAREARFEHGESPDGRAPRRFPNWRNRVEAWAEKVYGLDWEADHDFDDVEEEFRDWLAGKG